MEALDVGAGDFVWGLTTLGILCGLDFSVIVSKP